MGAVNKVIKNIDSPLLRAQKDDLLDHINKNRGLVFSDKIYAFQGLISLLDELQDAVVEDGIKTEKEVFG